MIKQFLTTSLLLPLCVAQAGEISSSISEDVEVRYYQSPEKLPGFEDQNVLDYGEQVSRLTALVSSGDWSVYAQLDQVWLVGNRYYLDDELFIEHDLVGDEINTGFQNDFFINVEKLRVTLEKSFLSLSIGDYYAAFGRGGALNVNRNVDIDLDTSITGVKSVYRPGDWEITALAGQLNRQQVKQDNPNFDIYGDLRHSVGAVRVERYGLGMVNLGLHGVAYKFVDEIGYGAGLDQVSQGSDAVVGGGTVEVMGLLGMDWYTEVDVIKYQSSLLTGEEDSTGFVGYLSGSAYLGATTWLLEGKHYDGAEQLNSAVGVEQYEVAVAPTLEYESVINEDSSAALNSSDISGGRVRVDWSVNSEGYFLTPYVSVAGFRDRDTEGLHFNNVPETIWHPLMGVEWMGEHWALLANAGYRVDIRDVPDESEVDDLTFVASGADSLKHMDVDLKFPILGKYHGDLVVGLQQFQWGENQFDQHDFTETVTALSVQHRGDLALTAFLDFSDNPLVDSVGNVSEDLYSAVELQVKPTTALTVKAFYGAYKAGIRCSGGQCRLLPGFEGARFSVSGKL